MGSANCATRAWASADFFSRGWGCKSPSLPDANEQELCDDKTVVKLLLKLFKVFFLSLNAFRGTFYFYLLEEKSLWKLVA
jgi:hypothetical protein